MLLMKMFVMKNYVDCNYVSKNGIIYKKVFIYEYSFLAPFCLIYKYSGCLKKPEFL